MLKAFHRSSIRNSLVTLLDVYAAFFFSGRELAERDDGMPVRLPKTRGAAYTIRGEHQKSIQVIVCRSA